MNNAQSGRAARAQQMEQTIRGYITACNAGDAEAVAATCTPDAVHYFPVHMYGDGSHWIIDGTVLCDPGHYQAAIEFTAERKNSGTIIRGSEWYRFDPGTGLISAIWTAATAPRPRHRASSGWS